jgi:hypothetical protein
LRLFKRTEFVRVGHPVSERAYTRGHTSFSSFTPSLSVSIAAKERREKQNKESKVNIFIPSV